MMRGFEFRYILLDEKLPSCTKEPHHEENNLVDVCSRVIHATKLISTCLEVNPASIVLTIDVIIYGDQHLCIEGWVPHT